MANGWSPENYALPNNAVSGVVTNRVVSREPQLTADGSRNLVVQLKCSGVTVVGSISARIQSGIGSQWEDAKSVTISGNGYFYIKLLENAAGDQTYLPLLAKMRVVVTTTNAGDAVTFDEINVLQGL